MLNLVAASFSLADSTQPVQTLFFLHFGFTVFMTGVIWFVQVVHYPLFRLIAPVEFSEYHRHHLQRAGWVVIPAMLMEAATGIFLVVTDPSILFDPLFGGALALLGIIWISTALVQLSQHRNLRRGGNDRRIVRGLVRANWFRTLAWTVRTILLATMVFQFISR